MKRQGNMLVRPRHLFQHIAVEGMVGEDGYIVVHAPLLCQHAYYIAVAGISSEQPLKQ